MLRRASIEALRSKVDLLPLFVEFCASLSLGPLQLSHLGRYRLAIDRRDNRIVLGSLAFVAPQVLKKVIPNV
jgi:hypothetical protein